jgi:O-antigen ligase
VPISRENRGAARLERRLDALIRGGILALVFLAPLPFGSVEIWAVSTLELCVAALALVWLYRLFLFPSTPVAGSPLFGPAVAFLLLMALQLVPLPAPVLKVVSPRTEAMYASALPGYSAGTREIAEAEAKLAADSEGAAGSSWRPVSQVPHATRVYLLRGVAFTILLFLVLNAFREPGQIRVLLYAVAGSGVVQAVYGLLEYLSGHQHIFAYRKKYYTDAATGTFINRNHFSLFLELALLVALGLLFSRLRGREAGRSWRERLLALTERRTSLNLLLSFGIAFLVVALVLSYSRAGMVFGVAAAGLFCLARMRQEWSVRKLAVVTLLAAALLVPAYGVGYWKLTGRYALLTNEITVPGGRLTVWERSLAMFRDHPLLGTGAGTFQHVFPRYRPSSVRPFYDYAHNDYVQLLSETGIAGGVILAWGLFLVLRLWLRGSPEASWATTLRSAVGFGLLAAGLHELVDFGLQIPANFLAVTLLAGALALLCSLEARWGPALEPEYA